MGVLDRFAIAAALEELAALLDLKGGENGFRSRAYRRGARAVAAVSEDLDALIRDGRLTTIPGVGRAIASAVTELHASGRLELLEALRAQMPPGASQLAEIDGLGLEKIARLHEELGVSTVVDLKAAAEAGRVRAVRGFGAKTEQKLLAAIDAYERRGSSVLLSDALAAADRVLAYLRAHAAVVRAEAAGEVRRFLETISELRIVAGVAKDPGLAVEHLAAYPAVSEVLSRGGGQCAVRLGDGLLVRLDAVRAAEFPVALFTATGSDAHVAATREAAARAGLTLHPTRLARAGRRVTVDDEAELYAAAGMQYVPPELRDGGAEVDAALSGEIPTDLVTLQDVRGLVHCHTVYSDGKNTVLEMARAAEAMGMDYITITDHSPTAFYAGGVEADRLLRQWDEIAEAQDQVRVRILRGTESDILADGSLDYPDEILERFDVIVASVHNRYKMDEDAMTRRVVRAMRQPVFKIWGHALGRLLDSRPPFACRVEEILDAVAESRAAIEINGDPHRLDLEPRWVREARARGIQFVLSTDAHSTAGLANVRFAVGIARRGGLRAGDVLNTRPPEAFARAVRPAA